MNSRMAGKMVKCFLLAFACLLLWIPSAVCLPPNCANTLIYRTEDYAYLVGHADYADLDGNPEVGSQFRWLVNGVPTTSGTIPELLLLHLDSSTQSADGEMPLRATGTDFVAGRWGGGLSLASGGVAYRRETNLELAEGTIELWVSPRLDGNDTVYATNFHFFFFYDAGNGDWISIAQAPDTGIAYSDGFVGGQWQRAYGFMGSGSTRTWRAGEWHHLAYTYSASGNFMRFYVDGILTADTDQGHYRAPAATGPEICFGFCPWASTASYAIDEVRILNRAATGDEIARWAARRTPPQANEVWLATAQLQPGDNVAFEFTPSDGAETGSACLSAAASFPGIPLTNITPPSTLLPPHTEEVSVSLDSIMPTSCRYSLSSPLPFGEMTPFDSGAGSEHHTTVVRGLIADPNLVNEVYVRCTDYPDYLLHARYRSLSEVNPSYPRKGNLLAWRTLLNKGLPYCARIDLLLGDWWQPEEIRTLRQLNPNIRVLTVSDAVENSGLTDDYYLTDIYGNRVEVWPGIYRLNMTKQYVAEHQARYAYQLILDSGLMFDGCFFDNVMTTQSWQNYDIYGNPFLVDSDEDGIVDDPAVFDAAWKAGVFHEMETFRSLMPHAIVSGHSMTIQEPGIAELFNGINVGFWTTDVIEGKQPFSPLWKMYQAWQETARAPRATMIESSPPDQISYGYGYSPWEKIPPSTLEFARTYYPYVRFGLAFTLMHDGYFAHEFGDAWHGNDWWYDELDFNLGYPTGPAEAVAMAPSTQVAVDNGGFELPLSSSLWNFLCNWDAGCNATVSRDVTDAAEGAASARVDVASTSGQDWHIALAQAGRSLTKDKDYRLFFSAKSNRVRPLTLSAYKDSPDWRNYGLKERITIGTDWREYSVSFTANETTTESRIQFEVGETTGSVWIDNVRLHEWPPEVLRREFTNGLVLLNPTCERQTVDIAGKYRRLTGQQAPKYEYILDDADAAFSVTGVWTAVTYDSGECQASGPFYHDWGPSCRQSSGGPEEARWDLSIPEADTFTISAWWPAAAATLSDSVVYEVVAGGHVVTTKSLSQASGGDEWHLLAEVALAPCDSAFVRVHTEDGKICIADALHVWSASRYNDGSPTTTVTLAPMDGIILARELPPDTDQDGLRDDVDPDDDNDGLPDTAEDVNGDGIVDPGETDPLNPDMDGDGLNDGQEVNVYHTDPLNADSDGDGVNDGVEVQWGFDPLNPDSTPHVPLMSFAGLVVLSAGILVCAGRKLRVRIPAIPAR